MKAKTLTLLGLFLFLGLSTQAQKIKEKDIIGTWQLVIDVEDEIDREAEEADTILGEILLKSISGMLSSILDNVDIYFEFKDDNTVFISASAYGEEDEEEARWFINKRGYLEIEDLDDRDDDDFNISVDDDQWKMEDGLLISVEHDDDRTVYMTRIN